MFQEPTVYLIFEIVISFFATPINAYTLYCILKKTPSEMKEYKIPLAFAQIFAMSLDLVLTSIKPELNFPAISGRIFGIWDSVFNLGAQHALATGGFLVVLTIAALTNMFFMKLQHLLDVSSRFKFQFFGKAMFMLPYFFMYPIWISGSFELLPLSQGTNTINFQELMKLHPTFSYLANVSDIYVGRLEPLYPPYINFTAIHMFCVGVFAFILHSMSTTYVCISWCYNLIQYGCPHMSKRTRKLQKKFFVALWIQHVIPTLSVGGPWFFYAGILITQPDFIYQCIYVFLGIIYHRSLFYESFFQIDVSENLRDVLMIILEIGSYLFLLLGFILSPIVIYFIVRNDQLSIPIRLLASTEFLLKTLYGLLYIVVNYCYLLNQLSPKFTCPPKYPDITYNSNFYNYLEILYDTSQYCQLMISIGRFFAVSFNGLYYRYALKWPLVQVLIPILLRVGLELIKMYFYWGPYQDFFQDYVMPIPIFLMCSLDFMTNRKLKSLKGTRRATRAERLLMIQMLCNSFLNVTNTIFLYIFSLFAHLFFVSNVLILWTLFVPFLKCFLFNFVASLLTAVFLQKRKDKVSNIERKSMETVLNISTRRSSFHR